VQSASTILTETRRPGFFETAGEMDRVPSDKPIGGLIKTIRIVMIQPAVWETERQVYCTMASV